MAEEKTFGQRLVALFFMGVVLFNHPILSLFNKPVQVAGIPLFFLYLFGAWLALVVLIGLATGIRTQRNGSGVSGD